MLGSNLVAQIVLEPSDSIWAANALFNPWIIETMKITVTTPTLTPRMVSADRSLLLRTVSSAINADSRMSIKFISHWLIDSMNHRINEQIPLRLTLLSELRLGRDAPRAMPAIGH